MMVAARGSGSHPVPLDQVAGNRTQVLLDHPWIASARAALLAALAAAFAVFNCCLAVRRLRRASAGREVVFDFFIIVERGCGWKTPKKPMLL